MCNRARNRTEPEAETWFGDGLLTERPRDNRFNPVELVPGGRAYVVREEKGRRGVDVMTWVPPLNRGTALPLGRYYPIILETDEERAELDRFLDTPRREPVRPDIFDLRPSQLRSDNVLISRYDPPISGWPWLSVCRWPDRFATAAVSPGVAMARGCYTMELFSSAAELDESQVQIVASLGERHEIALRLLTAQTMPIAGRA